ncbi:unnamed protein product [Knipowitschia caucasica]
MADRDRGSHVTEEVQVHGPKAPDSSSTHTYLNGQCVLSVSSRSVFNPDFDLDLCRRHLEMNGFQIPQSELEVPLETALAAPSVKRYITFNSSMFHFLMAPVLYLVLWCAAFSTLHLYVTVTDYWVLCLCVSLLAIFLTIVIIFILHRSNKEMNMNLDVRLIAVNEALVKHKLLVAVADWVENCRSHLQLYFVYWDMSRCLRAVTDSLDQHQDPQNVQKKLQKRLSHLVLVTDAAHAETEDVEQSAEEHRPLLQEDSSTSNDHRAALFPTCLSLVPDTELSTQDQSHQLLLTYSALYVKLLVSEQLSGPSHYRMRPRRNHCSTASLCLCQYIRTKILR